MYIWVITKQWPRVGKYIQTTEWTNNTISQESTYIINFLIQSLHPSVAWLIYIEGYQNSDESQQTIFNTPLYWNVYHFGIFVYLSYELLDCGDAIARHISIRPKYVGWIYLFGICRTLVLFLKGGSSQLLLFAIDIDFLFLTHVQSKKFPPFRNNVLN